MLEYLQKLQIERFYCCRLINKASLLLTELLVNTLHLSIRYISTYALLIVCSSQLPVLEIHAYWAYIEHWFRSLLSLVIYVAYTLNVDVLKGLHAC